MALRRLEGLSPDQLKYELLFVSQTVTYDQMVDVRRMVREPERAYAADLAKAQQARDIILRVDGARLRAIILFGSRARGDAHPDSDFDILVVTRGQTADQMQAYRLELWRVFRGTGIPVEPWVMPEEEFEAGKTVIGGLAYPAWKEGVVLHEDT